jgi:AcrR family transcriptional regulator
MKRQSRQQQEQHPIREAILDAADRLLAEYGYKKMTIDVLAREVGIGKGSVYLHFTSKEDIVLSHIDRIIRRLKVRMRAIASDEELSLEERLQQMLSARVLMRFDSVQHYSEGLDELLSHIRAPLLERRRRHFKEESQIIAGVIELGQKTGRFRDGDPQELARSLVLATNSFLPYSLSIYEFGERTEIAAQVEKLARLLIDGLRP